MRYYIREDIMPKVEKRRYSINMFTGVDAKNDQNTLPLTYCGYGYNISFDGGALKNGMGVVRAVINDNPMPHTGLIGKKILRSWIYYKQDSATGQRQDKIMALLDDGYIYVLPLDYGEEDEFEKTDMSFPMGVACGLNYHADDKDLFLLFGYYGGMYIYDGEDFESCPSAPGFDSVCVHYGRVYGTVSRGENKVYFSDELNPSNWNVSMTEAGYISFPDQGGKVSKVVSFNDYVFIFRQNGIHRLTAYTDFTEFKLTKVWSTASRIYGDTVTLCGDKIIFLADDGLYAFDGFTTVKIFTELFPLIGEKRYSHACYYDYRYYLACCLKNKDQSELGDEDEHTCNNAVIAFDLDQNQVNILRGADIGCFTPLILGETSQLLVNFNNFRGAYTGMIDDSGTLFGTPLKKLWQSPRTSLLRPDADKIIRRIYLKADAPLTITVGEGEDGEETVIEAEESHLIQTLFLSQKCQEVCVKLEWTRAAKFYLNGFLIEFDIIKRRHESGGQTDGGHTD
jgi:hypothetical protein